MTKSLSLDPGNEQALTNKGIALYNLGQHRESIKYMDMALEKNQKNADALGIKGYSLVNLGDYNQAIKFIESALRIIPDYDELLEIYANLLRELKR